MTHRVNLNLGGKKNKEGENTMERSKGRVLIGTGFLILFLLLSSIFIYAQDAETYYKNAYIYFTQENYAKAEEFYQKAIELNPDYEDAHYWLGKVYRQIGNYSKALEQWKKVLRINPQNSYAFSYLLNSYQGTPRVQSNKAIDYLREGLNLLGSPEEFLEKQDRFSLDYLLSVTPYFKRANNLEPNLIDAYFWLGEIYWYLAGQITSQFRSLAIENYRKVIDIEEATNSISFNHPSTYWRAYLQLDKIYELIQWKESRQELWRRLEKVRALPYQEALEEKGYLGFAYPSRIEVFFTDEGRVEHWIYPESEATFLVINGEVQGKKGEIITQEETEIKSEESIPEEKVEP